MSLDRMLSEVSQTQRTNTERFHFHEVPTVVTFIDPENGMVVAWGWRTGELGSSCLIGQLLGKIQNSGDEW